MPAHSGEGRVSTGVPQRWAVSSGRREQSAAGRAGSAAALAELGWRGGGGGGAGGTAIALTGSGSRSLSPPLPSPARPAQAAARSGAGRPGDSLPAPPRSPSSPPSSPRTLPAGLPGSRREPAPRLPAACDRRAVAASSADLGCVLLRPRRGGEGARGARQRETEVPGRGGHTKERAPPWAAENVPGEREAL
ncbi:CDC42 small effector protein 2 isoform X1 [Motacilla alba alba]|uniref:CDC42 small effector protein 2 isoform X1 n=1 Tax=Motacilla alba alba TaxID=1094192 RepID=UPI0018D5499D|nr:CDC42 small effector protein 2 isoform X1 [Motacilla alba alba]